MPSDRRAVPEQPLPRRAWTAIDERRPIRPRIDARPSDAGRRGASRTSRRGPALRRMLAAALVAVGQGGGKNLQAGPDWLASRGIEPRLTDTVDVIGNLTGGRDRGVGVANLLEAELSIDLETWAGMTGTRLFVLALGTHGRAPVNDVGSVHAPSNLGAVDAFRVYEFWLEHRFANGRLDLLAGLFAVDSEFDAKPTADLFVNGGFGTGLDLSETGRNGPSIFPVTSVGVRMRVRPLPGVTAHAAVLDGVPGDPDDPAATTVRFDEGDGLLVIGEVDVEPRAIDRLRVGFGVWRYTADFEDVVETDVQGDPVIREGSSGVYGFFEARLVGERGDRAQGLRAYARAGRADRRTNRFVGYASAGLVYTGLLPSREVDVAGIGVSRAINGDGFERARRRVGHRVDAAETVVEITYRAQLTRRLAIQPLIQYVRHPDTDPALNDSVAAGFRLGIDLF